MSRKAQPRCKRLVPPPGSGCWLLLVTVAELAGCVRGRSRAPSARASRRGADPTPAPRACSLFPRGAGARARPVACSPRRARSRDPRGGARSAIFPGSRARAGPLQPERRGPTVGAPSLLELLDLLQAQPRALVDPEVAQHLLHCLCVRVLHGCGGPAGLASRPRGLLASASHSDRALVPPRVPGRRLASPPPPPAASASRGAESPPRPLPQTTAPLAARPSRRPARAQRGGGGSRPFLSSSEGRACLALNRRLAVQAAAPRAPSPLS